MFRTHRAHHQERQIVSSNSSRLFSIIIRFAGVCTDQWRTQEFFFGGGSTNSVEDRGQRERGVSPLVRGSGGSCNLIQEVAAPMVTFY